MITKSEEESIMDEAIGGKIDDYLTKPVNPSQILSSCKKILESKKIGSERLSRDYTTEFNKISQALMSPLSWEEWIQIYINLSEWEVELDAHPESELKQILLDQKRECNSEFAKFVEQNYLSWIHGQNGPVLSKDVVSQYVKPLLEDGKRVIFLLLDNLRLDQWIILESLLHP